MDGLIKAAKTLWTRISYNIKREGDKFFNQAKSIWSGTDKPLWKEESLSRKPELQWWQGC